LQQEPSLGCVGQIYSLIAVLHQGILLSQHDPITISLYWGVSVLGLKLIILLLEMLNDISNFCAQVRRESRLR